MTVFQSWEDAFGAHVAFAAQFADVSVASRE